MYLMNQLSTRQFAALMLLIGVAWLLSLRFILVDQPTTHYHADFAIYIHGQQDELASFSFYEETTACALEAETTPQSRVHLHDQIATVAHVHDQATTWGHLFANLGYSLSNNTLATSSNNFRSNQPDRLRFILNGQQVHHVANKVIENEDTLLIDYSSDDYSSLLERYNSIPSGAIEANQKDDPQSCSGNTGESILNRTKRTLFGAD